MHMHMHMYRGTSLAHELSENPPIERFRGIRNPRKLILGDNLSLQIHRFCIGFL